jgi:glycosyltransferase involved in cell wall biosynthesis
MKLDKLAICIVTEEYPPDTNWGGIATYSEQLARGLSKKGHKVFVITRAMGKPKIVKEENISIIRIKTIFSRIPFLEKLIGYRLAVLLNLIKLIKKNKIDIIESPEWKAELVFFMMFNLHKRVPTVIRLHGCRKIIRYYNNESISLGDKFVIFFEKYILKKSKNITSISNAVLNETERVMKLKLKQKCKTIYNYLNKDYVIDNVEKKEQKDINLLYVGRLDVLKGVINIGKIVSKVIEVYPNVKFIFVGKDILNEQHKVFNSELIKRHIRKEDLKQVEFTGAIDKEEVNRLYRESYITILPSRFESFGLTCIESMMNETPVIGSKSGGMAEIITNNEDGILIDPNNIEELYQAIIKSIENKKLYNCMKVKCKDKVLRLFSADVIIPQIEKYYLDIIKQGVK